MKRPWLVWLVFGLCVALAATAMARVGSTALRLEHAAAAIRRQAALDENLQLALWRMDSALAPLIAEESARPYFAYSAFYPAERAYTSMFAEIQRGDVLMPSTLLTYTSTRVRVHFQFGPDGTLSSPQVPTGNMRDLAEARYVLPERIDEASQRLAALGRLVTQQELAAALRADEPAPGSTDVEPWVMAQSPGQEGSNDAPAARGSKEYQMRSRNTQQAQSSGIEQLLPRAPRSSKVQQGSLQAVWIGPALLLARRVRVDERAFLQGCWLDWEAIRAELLASVADLLPQPALEPVRSWGEAAPTRMLAALPVWLVPGTALDPPDPAWSPATLSLWIAWGCLGLAALAVGVLLSGAVALSQRRGAFVSAVTHELRTPLTTFRLYTEMLTEGFVGDEATRQSYLQTLRAEAVRLGHLVENVLSFARLERGQAADRREVVAPAALLARLAPQLEARARLAGMELVSAGTEASVGLLTDVSAVDQILSNLVDNACKYASAGVDRRIELEASLRGSWLSISVRDHGPGLASQASKRLFRPFSKSARDAANSAPGVGLGLALSRRLARALGGDLRLQQNGPTGACFALTLPLLE